MAYIFTLFTTISGLTAILFQTKIMRDDFRSLLDISPVRVLMALLILLATIFFCIYWFLINSHSRHSEYETHGNNHPPLEIITQIFFNLFSLCVILSIACETYYDNATIDKAFAYIEQAIPLLTFLWINSLFLCIFNLIHIQAQYELSVMDALRQIFFKGRIFWQAGFIFYACVLLMLAFIPIRDNYYPSHDYSIFAYIGQRIIKGDIPYLDLWDHKPPLIFYLNALGLSLSGGALIGIWTLEFLSLFLGGMLFFKALCRRFPEWLSLSATIFGILHYVRLFDFGNYTEEFSLLFQICAIAIYCSGSTEKRKTRALFSGLLCGLAFTCKQNAIGCWAAIFSLELCQSLINRKGFPIKKQIPRLVLFLSGFLIVNFAWAGYFASKGALAAYWDVAFRYNFLYSEQSGENRLACALTTITFLPSLTPLLSIAFFSWVGVVFSLISSLIHEKRQGTSINSFLFDVIQKERLVFWVALALPLELFLASLSGMNYQHYFILCIPSVCGLICWFGERFYANLRRYLSANKAIYALVIFFAFCSLPLERTYRDNYAPRMPSAYTKAAAFLSSNTSAEEPVLVWGSRTALYVMSKRAAPTPYFNQRPLYLFPGYVEATQWAEFLNDLEENPPKFIIHTRETSLPMIDFDGNGNCLIPPAPDYRAATYAFLCRHYTPYEILNEGMQDEWIALKYN